MTHYTLVPLDISRPQPLLRRSSLVYDHVRLDAPYYRNNLYVLLEALASVPLQSVQTGDWFEECRFHLAGIGAERDGGNTSVESLATSILTEISSRTGTKQASRPELPPLTST